MLYVKNYAPLRQYLYFVEILVNIPESPSPRVWDPGTWEARVLWPLGNVLSSRDPAISPLSDRCPFHPSALDLPDYPSQSLLALMNPCPASRIFRTFQDRIYVTQ